MKFTLPNASSFERGSVKGRVFNTHEDFPALSSELIEIRGQCGKTRNDVSDRLYFVLKGRGDFLIGDKKFSCEESDTIIVPKGKEYNIVGDMTVFLVHSPAFNSEAEVQEEVTSEGIRKMKVIVRE